MTVGIASLTEHNRGSQLPGFEYVSPHAFKPIELHSDPFGYVDITDETEAATRFGTMIDLMTRYLIVHDPHAFDSARQAAQRLNRLSQFNQCVQILANYRPNPTVPLFADHNLFKAGQYLAELENDAKGRRSFGGHAKVLTSQAIYNAQLLLIRTLSFFNTFGQASTTGFHVHNADHSIVGEGDYLSASYLMDMKVSKHNPIDNPGYRAQVMMYYVYGHQQPIEYAEFNSLQQIILFNPRYDTAWTCDIRSINTDMTDYILNLRK